MDTGTKFHINHSIENKHRGQELSKIVTDFVNNYNSPDEDFLKALKREHRTLQQSATRLFLKAIETMAETEHTDARNEAAVKTCREIVQAYEDKHGFKPSKNLPLI